MTTFSFELEGVVPPRYFWRADAPLELIRQLCEIVGHRAQRYELTKKKKWSSCRHCYQHLSGYVPTLDERVTVAMLGAVPVLMDNINRPSPLFLMLTEAQS